MWCVVNLITSQTECWKITVKSLLRKKINKRQKLPATKNYSRLKTLFSEYCRKITEVQKLRLQKNAEENQQRLKYGL